MYLIWGIFILLWNFYISTDDSTNNLTIYHSVQGEYSELLGILFPVFIPFPFCGFPQNSLHFHEIAIQIVYFSVPDAITYPLILQYCHAEPTADRIDSLTPCNSTHWHETFLRMPWICGSRYRKSTGKISLAFIFVVELFAARSSRSLHFAKRNSREKKARMWQRNVTGVRINAIQDPNCNLSAWIATNASKRRTEDP